MRSFMIDRVRLVLDLPDGLIDSHLLPFEGNPEESENIRGTITVRLTEPDTFVYHPGEKPEICETEFAKTEIFGDRIYCFFRDNLGWLGISVKDDEVLCVPDGTAVPGCDNAALLFDYMKGGIFLLFRKFGYYILHSSSVTVNGKVLAFTAESGVGKTTHTRFWEKLYHTPVFNGDMIMIDSEAEIPQAIGIPWSGSTGLTTVGKSPFAGIFFLERGKTNEIREVSELEKMILLTQRMLSVNYNHRVFLENIEQLKKAALQIPCARLFCLPDENAAETARKYAEDRKWI